MSATNPLGQTVNRFIDSAGRALSARDPMGRTTKFQYDALNRPTQVIVPLQGVAAVAYDSLPAGSDRSENPSIQRGLAALSLV